MKIKRNDRDECIYIETRRKRKEKEELRKEKKNISISSKTSRCSRKRGERGGGDRVIIGDI